MWGAFNAAFASAMLEKVMKPKPRWSFIWKNVLKFFWKFLKNLQSPPQSCRTGRSVGGALPRSNRAVTFQWTTSRLVRFRPNFLILEKLYLWKFFYFFSSHKSEKLYFSENNCFEKKIFFGEVKLGKKNFWKSKILKTHIFLLSSCSSLGILPLKRGIIFDAQNRADFLLLRLHGFLAPTVETWCQWNAMFLHFWLFSAKLVVFQKVTLKNLSTGTIGGLLILLVWVVIVRMCLFLCSSFFIFSQI